MKFAASEGKIQSVAFKRCIRVFDIDGKFAPEYDETDKLGLPCDSVIVSIGQKPSDPAVFRKFGIKTLSSGHVALENAATQATSADGVFAGGDLVKSEDGGKIIGAVAAGQRAAYAIDAYIAGTISKPECAAPGKLTLPEKYCLTEIVRNEMQLLPVIDRFTTPPEEVNVPFRGDSAKDEASRCLQCGLGKAQYIGEQNSDNFNLACNNCHNCVAVCTEKAIQFHYYTKKKNGKWVA
jgi:NADPH-dependent glutamate synthase beta subunit-like oxidoreductase